MIKLSDKDKKKSMKYEEFNQKIQLRFTEYEISMLIIDGNHSRSKVVLLYLCADIWYPYYPK